MAVGKKTSKDYTVQFLRDLFLGLIYPAVLGNIIYQVIMISFNFDEYRLYDDFNIKFSILFITLLFYLFDYLYLYFTYNLKRWMFVFDFSFIILLFWTIQLLYIHRPGSTKVSPPFDILSVTQLYLAFIILYFLGDAYEFYQAKDKKEKKLLRFIITWEATSAGLLGVCFLQKSQLFTVIILGAITLCFGVVNYFKYRYWIAHKVALHEKLHEK